MKNFLNLLSSKFSGKLDSSGSKRWHNDQGQLHRIDGPAIEWDHGSKEWYIDGILHREDGPAIEFESGYKAWYINGERHREDGPAIQCSDGDKQWFFRNTLIDCSSQEEFLRLIKMKAFW